MNSTAMMMSCRIFLFSSAGALHQAATMRSVNSDCFISQSPNRRGPNATKPGTAKRLAGKHQAAPDWGAEQCLLEIRGFGLVGPAQKN